MGIRIRTSAVVTALLLTASAAYAQSGSKQLVITSAAADRASNTVTFKGRNFGGRKATVFCETTEMRVLSASDEELVASFPASSLNGTYLFTVLKGNSSNDRDVFYVTTSTAAVVAGPQGPQGVPGPVGPVGRGHKVRPGRKVQPGRRVRPVLPVLRVRQVRRVRRVSKARPDPKVRRVRRVTRVPRAPRVPLARRGPKGHRARRETTVLRGRKGRRANQASTA